MNITAAQAARFWAKVDKSGACWLWTGAHVPKGYGVFMLRRGQILYTHRLSYFLAHGAIPTGLSVLHRCDVPACVHPDHLFTGTPAENSADMVEKGRSAHQYGPTYLIAPTLKQVRKARGVTQAELARRMGCSQGLVAHFEIARAVSLYTIEKIATALDVPPETLLRQAA